MSKPEGLETWIDDMRTLGYHLERSEAEVEAATAFGRKLRAVRSIRKMKREDLVKATGLPEGVIVTLENGNFHPDRVDKTIIGPLEKVFGEADGRSMRVLLGQELSERGGTRGRQRGRD